ncbi:MAG: arginine--tRNA ligase, partial [Hyphomicrobiales bacterium]|nr:arginine--tRNA ligase [Hyphomicrobiales bacterium]
MNIFKDFEARFLAAANTLKAKGILPEELDVSRMTVEPPRDASHGDIASNAAMIFAKPAGMPPRDLAAHFVQSFSNDPDVAKAEIAGPGFINLTLIKSYWPNFLRSVLTAGEDFGRSDMGGREPVNVEFVSANPTGPMHVGHCRGAVFGDALANLLDHAGYKVTREYYVNDAGAQVDVLARSAYLRYREALGETIEIPEGFYPGDYLCAVGEALKKDHGERLSNMDE